jgi:two-component system OmpR family response regulator
MARILLVEDDKRLAAVIKDWLECDNHIMDLAANGLDAGELISTYNYDIVLLDWELPERNGIEVLKQAREHGKHFVVMLLTGRKDISDKETAFKVGADDYLTKPFELRELSARIWALLRRSHPYSENELQLGGIRLSPEKKTVTVGDKLLELWPKEFALLQFLLKNPNHVFSAAALLNNVWPYEADITENAIRITMTRLRKKLRAAGECPITTMRAAGYVLRDNARQM